MAQQEHGNWGKKALDFICFFQAFCSGSGNRLFGGTQKGARDPPGKSLPFFPSYHLLRQLGTLL